MEILIVSHYFVITKPYRQDFMSNPKEEENMIMGEHFEYLKSLLNQGKLFLAGPTLKIDDPFGIYIFIAENEEEANQLINNDPSVKKGIQNIDLVREMRISLLKDR